MGLKNKLLTGLAALVLASGTAKAETYTYFDDFETKKVEYDAAKHSPIFEVPPQMGTGPFLVLNDCRIWGQALAFYTGRTLAGDAYICYKFPLNGRVNGVNSGILSFKIGWNYWDNSGPGHIKVGLSDNGTEWANLYEQDGILVPPPVYQLNLNIPHSGASHQYIKIEGTNIIIDDLLFSLDSDNVVPNNETSWGQIKSLYQK